jgi:haloalkane dehalogenase
MNIFRTPDERFEGLPGWEYEPHYVEVDGLRLHYVDEAPDADGNPIVCFHGEPTWGYLYRKMIPPLTEAGHRVICPDYAGFGRSDKPTDRGWYGVDTHLELVSKLLEGFDLSEATVVVHDWGGAIGLRWAVENADRVGALVILNTGLFDGRVSKGFMAWRDFAEKNPDMPVGNMIQGGSRTDLPDDVVAAYDAPFPTSESKAGVAQFPLLVPLDESDPVAVRSREIAHELSRWQKPTLVAFSDEDPITPHPKAGEVFTKLIPTAGEQLTIEGGAHFLQEDRGELIAGEVVKFLRES